MDAPSHPEVMRSLRAAAYAESVALRDLCRFVLHGRLPFAPLERQIRAEWAGCSTHMQTWGFGATETATRLHVTPSTVHRLRREGLTRARADRFATLLNLHPAMIWPDLWFADIDLDAELDGLTADLVAAS